MNKNILKTDIQSYINENINADTVSLVLKKQNFEGAGIQEIAEQIEAKKRCKKKLPTWFNTPLIYYPNKLNIEQTSSEETAEYKTSLVQGTSLIDITGGFGVDTFYFSKKFKSVTHCEINKNLSEIVQYNFGILQAKNVTCINDDGLEYLDNTDLVFDCIYVDPSRRSDIKGKVFKLEDCLPNVPEHLDLLFQKTRYILIKTSPMLDISIGIAELKWIKEIHIVALNNEVKELLWILEKDCNQPIGIGTVNIKEGAYQLFNFNLHDINESETVYSIPLTYLYEPNPAIMKSGAFNIIPDYFPVKKLHRHSHLYTSDEIIDFPGRVFKIEEITPYSPKKLRKELNGTMANVATRNFPETANQIKNKLKIKDGGENYLFFTTDSNNKKVVLFCKKVV